jgi:hypothetical protein
MTAITSRQDINWAGTLTNVPDLRNGSVADVSSMACRASIPAMYFWANIVGLTKKNAMANLDLVVRSTQITLGNTPAAREKALVMGVTRAVSVAAWGIVEGEINGSERTPVIINIVNDIATWATGFAVVGNATAALSVAEQELVPFLMHMAAPVVALQGLSLVETDHHFIATTAMYFTKHKDHVMKSTSNAMRDLVTSLGTDFNDVMFHKACHPISTNIKMGIARSVTVSTRLRASNCPTAAIRFPAVPGEVKAARAALALVNRASPTVVSMGGSVSVECLTAAVTALSLATTPATMISASAALAIVMDAMKPNIAYCAGIVRQEQEAAGVVVSTLMNSHFIKRIIDEHAVHVGDGVAIAKARAVARSMNVREGTTLGRTIA